MNIKEGYVGPYVELDQLVDQEQAEEWAREEEDKNRLEEYDMLSLFRIEIKKFEED